MYNREPSDFVAIANARRIAERWAHERFMKKWSTVLCVMIFLQPTAVINYELFGIDGLYQLVLFLIYNFIAVIGLIILPFFYYYDWKTRKRLPNL